MECRAWSLSRGHRYPPNGINFLDAFSALHFRMDWKLFIPTFGAVFLAELGDKTQLATMALAAESKSKLTVFVAASAALVVAAGLGVLLGDALTRFVPSTWIQRGAALLFFCIGGWLLWSSSGRDDRGGSVPPFNRGITAGNVDHR